MEVSNMFLSHLTPSIIYKKRNRCSVSLELRTFWDLLTGTRPFAPVGGLRPPNPHSQSAFGLRLLAPPELAVDSSGTGRRPRNYMLFRGKNAPARVPTALAPTSRRKKTPLRGCLQPSPLLVRKKNAMGPGQGGFKATQVQGNAVSRTKIMIINLKRR